MTRTPWQLAALASSAVPGLDPAAVQAARTGPGHQHEVAFVTDSQHRMWVVRAPMTPAAGAQMDTTVALLGLIGRRLPFAVPAPRGFVGVPEGRVAVYPHISGRPINLATLPPGPGLAAEVGRTLAAIHNLDRRLFDEASLPVYEAETFRTRRLADLDRAAATGHVPTGLLSRWERVLEDVSMWRFAPTPIHGDISGDQILVVFEDETDAASGRVRGITGWDDAQVADPAEDFAAIVTQCDEQTIETILEAYANSRVERPDPHLRRRAKVASELRLLTALLSAVSAGSQGLIRAYAADLRDLDERTIDEPDEPRGPVPALPQETAFDRESLEVLDEGDIGSPAADLPEDATQPIGGNPFDEHTSVIPAEELERLRQERVTDRPDPGETDDGVAPGETDEAGEAEAPGEAEALGEAEAPGEAEDAETSGRTEDAGETEDPEPEPTQQPDE
ncbi:MAG: phosphotransferase, partial [Lapillicoccus sp.]